MKKFTITLLVVLAASFALISNTGCAGSGTPTPQDTTDNNPDDTTVTVKNGFRIGLDTYKVTTSDGQSFAVYNAANDKTYITIVGRDDDQSTDEEAVVLYIDVDSNMVGTYVQAENDAELSLGLGSGVKKQDFSSTSLTVTITEYGASGGRIKGTFSGKAKAANQTNNTDIAQGFFDVIRNPDE